MQLLLATIERIKNYILKCWPMYTEYKYINIKFPRTTIVMIWNDL